MPKPKPHLNGDRILPHSLEAEACVLSCAFQQPELLDTITERLPDAAYYDLRHQWIYRGLKAAGCNTEAVYLWLKGKGETKSIDVSFLSRIEGACPSPAGLTMWLDIVAENYRRRCYIDAAKAVLSRSYDVTIPYPDLEFANNSDLAEVISSERAAEEVWELDQLQNFDVSKDTNTLIGIRDDKTPDGKPCKVTTRFLCRGYGAWLIGPSGVGKSSFISQWAFHFALGRPIWGITPVRPLRILIIQAENDQGDAAEMTQGILRSIGIDEFNDPEAYALLKGNIVVITERRTVGQRFCAWLARKIAHYQAEVVFVDPFLSFAGVDVTRNHECSKFLRGNLNPVLSDTGALLIAAHHTGKPRFEKGLRAPTALDYAYAGLGGSELVNWARAVMVLQPMGEQHYELKLAKRGQRAGACQPDGTFTTSVYLRHARDHIFWEQVEPPQEPEESTESRPKGGKPSVIKEVASMNLYEFIKGCNPEGEGLNAISKRLECWLATQRKDISVRTCQRVIPLLVENGKLTKNAQSMYVKGANA